MKKRIQTQLSLLSMKGMDVSTIPRDDYEILSIKHDYCVSIVDLRWITFYRGKAIWVAKPFFANFVTLITYYA